MKIGEHAVKALEKAEVPGISKKTMETHHGKLYTGYVNKRNEIEKKLEVVDKTVANATYSEFGELKRQETFAANGQVLHEIYFSEIGGDGIPKGKVAEMIKRDFGSVEKWLEEFKACGMSARGWVVLALDPSDGRLHNFIGDAHNQGGVWGAIPLLDLDVYEHAYFIDYGSDRKAYLEAFVKTIDWKKVDEMAEKRGVK
jgi:Fe-Mn family superoxide dismutase